MMHIIETYPWVCIAVAVIAVGIAIMAGHDLD
jgi:hypothetical protein